MEVRLRVVWLIPSGQHLYKHTLHFQTSSFNGNLGNFDSKSTKSVPEGNYHKAKKKTATCDKCTVEHIVLRQGWKIKVQGKEGIEEKI
jgi:hypothetical protein